jgi:hypothetical protein
MANSVADPPAAPSLPSTLQVDATVALTTPPPPAPKPDPPKKKHPIEYLQALTPLIIAAVGWFVTDAVRSGFERQRLQLSNVTEMRDLLVKLVGPSVTLQDAQAAASTLSAFGEAAVPPLVTALASADDVRTPPIEDALRAIGLNHAQAVCDPLLRILGRPTGRFTWLLHRSAIRVVGDIDCPNAGPVLQGFKNSLANGTLKTYDPASDDWIAVPPEAVQLLNADLTRAVVTR